MARLRVWSLTLRKLMKACGWIWKWPVCQCDSLKLPSHSSATEVAERTEPANSSRVGAALSWWLWKWIEGSRNLQGWPWTVWLIFFPDECTEIVLKSHCAIDLVFVDLRLECWYKNAMPTACHCELQSTAWIVGQATALIVLWLKNGSSTESGATQQLDCRQDRIALSDWTRHCLVTWKLPSQFCSFCVSLFLCFFVSVFLCFFVSLSLCFLFFLVFFLFLCFFVCLFVCLLVCSFLRFFVSLLICSFVFLHAWMYAMVSACLHVSMSVCMSDCLFVCLPVCSFGWLFAVCRLFVCMYVWLFFVCLFACLLV